MSIPTDTAARSAARDAAPASETPKSLAASRPLSSSVASPKSNLAGSIEAHKELALKSGPAPHGIADKPLAVAYEQRIHTLQDSLKERDQIVQMLTQRLEQAADQLDRVQRTGSGRNSAAAGIPSELLENQQVMAEQVKQLLAQWEELQAADLLARIESRITELHDLVSSGAVTSAAIAATPTDKETADHSLKTSAGISVFSQIPAAEPAKIGWEAIKAAVLAGESYTLPTSGSCVASSNGALQAIATDGFDEDGSLERSAPPPLPDPPPAVDLDIADRQQLCDAILAREEFISMLLRRLSSPDANTEFPDWDQLNFVPEDLHRELLGLRDRLQDKLRVAEVDLSLQRAKLAREDSKLTLKANQVARQMKQLGLSPDELDADAGGPRAVNEGTSTTQGRRWLQFLQRSNGSGNDGK